MTVADFNPYDRKHRDLRTALIREALGTECPGGMLNGKPWRSDHCDRIMTNPKRMQLDHTTPVIQGGRRGDRICCLPCNSGAGAALANQRKRGERPRPWHSRSW